MTQASVGARPWTTIDWLRSTPSIAVPVYQREYRWTQVTCDRLLQDLRAVASAQGGGSHFLGSILIKPEPGGVTLVDGQQRVTTLMLLLAAIGEHARRTGDPVASEVSGILASPTRPGAIRLIPHKRYETVLRAILLAQDAQDAPAAETVFEDNYQFLLDRIEPDWRQIWSGLAHLEHVTIELGAGSSAQQVFESLNSTGAPLSDDELIHNYVHMGRTHDEQVELERETWVPIEEATAPATRQFWRDYLILTADETPDFVGDFGIYRSFKQRYPSPIHDVTLERRAEWLRYAESYRAILHPAHEADSGMAEQLRQLRNFANVPRPFILAVYDAYRVAPHLREAAISTLRQFQTMLIRRAVVGLETSSDMIGRLCRDSRGAGDSAALIIGLTAEDASVRLGLRHGSLPRADYVLSRMQTIEVAGLDLQVEHIYPQTPKSDWSLDGSATWAGLPEDERARYRALLNTIGNLTLLEAHLNQAASNRSFVDKTGYYRKSDVAETRSLADRQAWGTEAIEQRTQELTEAFLTTWPRESDTPMAEDEDLLRVVDLPTPPLRGYPWVFEYAVFQGAIWGEVHTSKGLLVRLVNELYRIDPDRLTSAEYSRLIVDNRKPRKAYAELPNGKSLLVNWAHRYLLEVAQSFTSHYGLEDALKVKLAAIVDEDSTE